jgi:hypothetical protein
MSTEKKNERWKTFPGEGKQNGVQSFSHAVSSLRARGVLASRIKGKNPYHREHREHRENTEEKDPAPILPFSVTQ